MGRTSQTPHWWHSWSLSASNVFAVEGGWPHPVVRGAELTIVNHPHPPVLCSMGWPDGLPWLTPKQAREMHTANALKDHTLMLADMLHRGHTWIVLENPGFVGDNAALLILPQPLTRY